MIRSYLHHRAQPYWPLIYRHPMNIGLQTGTLSRLIFCDFLRQDKPYLFKLASCLKDMSLRSSHLKHQEALAYVAYEASKEPEKLHDKYIMMDDRLMQLFKVSDTKTLAYHGISDYMRHLHVMTYTSSIPLAYSIASVLPCFYIYSHLGQYMHERSLSCDNPYQLWIDSYASPNFLWATDQLFMVLEELMAQHRTDVCIDEVTRIFLKSVQYEIAFWDHVCANVDEFGFECSSNRIAGMRKA